MAQRPVYIDVYTEMLRDIQTGLYPENSLFPPEEKLCRKYNASRSTLRRALNMLKETGVLYSVQGNGTYIKPFVFTQPLSDFYSFTDTLKSSNILIQNSVIHYDLVKADKLDTTARANFASFADASQVSSYAKDAMSWAVASKLIYGKGKNNLDPRGTATRAEVAAFVMRFTKLMDKQAESTPEKQTQTEAAQTPASQVDPAPAEAPQAETDVPAEAAAPSENG